MTRLAAAILDGFGTFRFDPSPRLSELRKALEAREVMRRQAWARVSSPDFPRSISHK